MRSRELLLLYLLSSVEAFRQKSTPAGSTHLVAASDHNYTSRESSSHGSQVLALACRDLALLQPTPWSVEDPMLGDLGVQAAAQVRDLGAKALAALAEVQWTANKTGQLIAAVYKGSGSDKSGLPLMKLGLSTAWESSSGGEKAAVVAGGLAAVGVFLAGLYYVLPKIASYVRGDSANKLVPFSINLALPIGTLGLDLQVPPDATTIDILAAVRTSAPYLPEGIRLFEHGNTYMHKFPTGAGMPFSSSRILGLSGHATPFSQLGLNARWPLSGVLSRQWATPVAETRPIFVNDTSIEVIAAYSNPETCQPSPSGTSSTEAPTLRQLRENSTNRAARFFDALLDLAQVKEKMHRMYSFIKGLLKNIIAMADADSPQHLSRETAAVPCWTHVPQTKLLAAFGTTVDLAVSSDGGAAKAAVHLAAKTVEGVWADFVRAVMRICEELEEFLRNAGAIAPLEDSLIRRHIVDLQRLLAEAESQHPQDDMPLQVEPASYQKIVFVTENLVRDVVASLHMHENTTIEEVD